MDLIRLLLLRTEGNNAAGVLCAKFPVPERAYHAQLLKDAGLVEAIIRKDEVGNPNGASIQRLTWAGHDFLDSLRNEDTWEKVKRRALNAGAWTMGLLVELGKEEAKKALGL